MTPLFKKLLLSFTIYLLIFIGILATSIFVINFFSNKINNELEERNNIMKMVSYQQAIAQQNFLISSKISELEKKYNINFSELKNKLLTPESTDKETLKNLLNEIAKENGIIIRNIKTEELDGIFQVEIEGNINDVVKFERGIKLKKLNLLVDEIRMIKENQVYLIKISLSTF